MESETKEVRLTMHGTIEKPYDLDPNMFDAERSRLEDVRRRQQYRFGFTEVDEERRGLLAPHHEVTRMHERAELMREARTQRVPLMEFSDVGADKPREVLWEEGKALMDREAREKADHRNRRVPIWTWTDPKDSESGASTTTNTISQAGPAATQNLPQTENEALLIPEILEVILSFLPSPDLWRAQNVCQAWRSNIQSSPTLRRSLGYTSTSDPVTPNLNRFINRLWRNRLGENLTSVSDFILNPVLLGLNLLVQKGSDRKCNYLVDLHFPARWRTVDATWRDLQICEPPVKRIFLKSAWLDKYIDCETGVTAGMLADYLEITREGMLWYSHVQY